MIITLDTLETTVFKNGSDDAVNELFYMLRHRRRLALSIDPKQTITFVTADNLPVEPGLPPPKRE